jgi:hypothetical protein
MRLHGTAHLPRSRQCCPALINTASGDKTARYMAYAYNGGGVPVPLRDSAQHRCQVLEVGYRAVCVQCLAVNGEV